MEFGRGAKNQTAERRTHNAALKQDMGLVWHTCEQRGCRAHHQQPASAAGGAGISRGCKGKKR